VFHDAGVRVAKLLLLALVPDDPSLPPQQLIVVNTHLLFPHDHYSRQIRKREMTKILGYVCEYRRTTLCSSTSGRSPGDVKLPVLIAGDFNGSPTGSVQSLMLEKHYQNAFVEHTGNLNWVSHKNHKQTVVPVDHVMFLNPSDQQLDKLGPVPDWTNLVYQELHKEIVDRHPEAVDAMREVFNAADQNKNNALSKDEFENLLKTLGFTGKGPALTSEEVDLLVASADKDGNGQIDFKEFLDRFGVAVNPSKDSVKPITVLDEVNSYARAGWLTRSTRGTWSTSSTPVGKLEEKRLDQARPCGDLTVRDAILYPPELEHGKWPDHWNLSDHGMVMVDFLCKALPAGDPMKGAFD
jgi:hypothetical protein